MIHSNQRHGHERLRRPLGLSGCRSWTGSYSRRNPVQAYLSVSVVELHFENATLVHTHRGCSAEAKLAAADVQGAGSRATGRVLAALSCSITIGRTAITAIHVTVATPPARTTAGAVEARPVLGAAMVVGAAELPPEDAGGQSDIGVV